MNRFAPETRLTNEKGEGVDFGRHQWIAGCALLFVLVLGGVVTKLATDRAASSLLEEIAGVVGERRIVAPRLTGFEYAPCEPGDTDETLVSGLVCADRLDHSKPEIASLASRIRGRGESNRTLESLHARGVWALLWVGDSISVKYGIDLLREATTFSGAAAEAWSDLAAALMVGAQITNNPRLLVDAYAAVDTAIALDPSLPEASYNRALVLERLFLRQEAAAAWNKVAEMEGSSRWAFDIESRQEDLPAPDPDWSDRLGRLHRLVANGDVFAIDRIVADAPWLARVDAHRGLRSWATAMDKRQHVQADSLLQIVRATGDALWRTTNNKLIVDAVAVIDEAVAAGDISRLAALVQGQLALDSGFQYLSELNLTAAKQKLDRSFSLLRTADSPMRHWATMRLAGISYQRATSSAYDKALDELRALRRETNSNYRVVRAFAAQTMCLINIIRMDYAAALSIGDVAFREGTDLGEPEVSLRLTSWLVPLRNALHGQRQAWAELYRALEQTPRFRHDGPGIVSVYSSAALTIPRRLSNLALLFQDEVVRAAERWGSGPAQIGALITQAEFLAEMGRTDDAFGSLKDAREMMDGLAGGARTPLAADLNLALGRVATHHSDEELASQSLVKAAEEFERTDYRFRYPDALVSLADLFINKGDLDSAQILISRAAAAFETQRTTVVGLVERTRFLHTVRPIIDKMIEVLIDQGRPGEAYAFLTGSRERLLLETVERWSEDRSGPIDGAHVTHMNWEDWLPENSTTITYVVLDSTLLVWLHSSGVQPVFRRLQIGAQDVRERVDQLDIARVGASHHDFVREVLSSLFDLLIEPIAADIPVGSRVTIIPDKWLHFIPFAALWDEKKGRYFVEANEISIAPSGALYWSSLHRYNVLRERQPLRALVIGNPQFDRKAFALPYLPGAEDEARRVRDVYGSSSVVLTGGDATKSAFLNRARDFDVVHLAGHAIVRTDAPLRSSLLFASDGGAGTGQALYAEELFELELPSTRIAILSGCHTAAGWLSATEGASSLARSLLMAGVPLTVASLWAVDDVSSGEFMVAYHTRLAAGEDPISALRATQLAWIEQSDQHKALPTWAAFQIFGST